MPAPAQSPQPEKREINWGKFSKTVSFWILIILIPVIIFTLQGARGETAKMNFNPAFRDQILANNIDTVVVQDDRWTGKFREPVSIAGKQYTRFLTQVQKEHSAEELQRLYGQHVQVRYADPTPSITAWIVNFLPWLLII